MKKILLSLFIFCFSSLFVLADEVANEKKVPSKYKMITYDVFGGLMYGAGFASFDDVDETGISPDIRVNSLYLFAGADFYAGGYYDKIAKRYKEYLITPMFGVQFDYNVWNKSSDNGNIFTLKNHLNLLFRLGVLFKLKFDTNAKLYFLVGMAQNSLKVLGNHYILPPDGWMYDVKKVKDITALWGFGLDFIIKQHFLIGFEYRNIKFYHDNTYIKLDQYEDYPTSDNSFPLGLSMHYIMIKAGFAF